MQTIHTTFCNNKNGNKHVHMMFNDVSKSVRPCAYQRSATLCLVGFVLLRYLLVASLVLLYWKYIPILGEITLEEMTVSQGVECKFFFRDALVKVGSVRGEIVPSSARMVSNCNCLCVRAPSSDKTR